MSTAILVLIALGAGLFIGDRYDRAHVGHGRFRGHQRQSIQGLSAWLDNTVVVVVACAFTAAVFLLLLHVL